MIQTETTLPAQRLVAWLRRTLGRRVLWLTDDRRDVFGTASAAAGLVTVLGREHYTERRARFPVLSRRDLDGVLSQELAGAPPTLVAISEPSHDWREVVFYQLREGVLDRVGRVLWLVPESVLVARSLSAGSVAAVERDGFRYFVASSGASQAGGGTIDSPELFALAAGFDEGADVMALDRNATGMLLLPSLLRLPPGAWLRFRKPGVGARWQVDWRPLAAVAAAGLVAYLGFASGYLAMARKAREAALADLGPEVETLLEAQRSVDDLAVEHAGLAKVANERVDSYVLWRIVAVAWSKGAELSGVEIKDRELTLRGRATLATDVLAAIAAVAGVKNARFSAPVRSERSGLEEFSITLTLLAEAGRG